MDFEGRCGESEHGQPQDMTSRQTRLRDRYLNVSDMPDDERVAYK